MRSKLHTQKFQERLGFYQVGNLKFRNAFDALITATKQGIEPKWNFNESTFRNFSWNIPIETSLDELYRSRAQQLRDEYDHLILNFSGGKDSINILLTFINNNIFLDEIVMNFPFPMEKKFNNTDQSQGNNFSEIEYAAKVILKKYQNKIHPDTIIRYQDLAEPNAKLMARDDWSEILPVHIGPTVTSRLASHIYDDKLIDLAMKQKLVANIYGIDKPRIVYHDHAYYFNFTDIPMHAIAHSALPEYQLVFDQYIHYEPFYWTPFMPEIVAKQSQVIVDALEFDAPLKFSIQNMANGTHQDFLLREQMMCKYLYSDHEQVWQTEKPQSGVFRTLDAWFWETVDNKTKHNFIETVEHTRQLVDISYYRDLDPYKGKKPHVSGGYLIKQDV
jgi:hypothetical protein